ncbi:CHAT domain-containing protein [Micromonospora profundi]|uniref:CHAT domain-containing protein n=1 Tax=Micromonospora profundi TaxID=1420889 RepID=UPI0033AC426F
MSEKQYRDKIASIKKQQAAGEAGLAKVRSAAAKHRSDAAKELAKITPKTSASMARSYQRNAESAEKKALAEDVKIKNYSKKLGSLAGDLATAESNLDREVRAAARKAENDRKAAERRAEQEANQRRTRERRHAQEIARLSSPTVRYVHEVREIPTPKPEVLRVLYLTANPEMNLRTEVEVRDVQQAVRKATHRDLIEISYRPAATPEDLLDGLNDLRPHVVHFSGHAGNAAVLFDNASVDTPDSRKVTFDLLARVLDATTSPPAMLVLNGCDTLDGAEVLLDSTPVVIAMAAEITDLAASAFAARFYSAIASAQPIGPAVRQGAVALDLAGLNEGWKPTVSAREDVKLEQLVLVRPTPE